ncbi:MAG: twin-arginine translocation signal domain-containing protein [Halioglobus sp.]
MSLNRRDVLKGAALAASSLALASSRSAFSGTDGTPLKLPMAGYPYNHVKPLMDGRVKVEGCDTDFTVDKIGNLNNHIFSGPQTRGITEIGLAPFMLAYANDNFRDYSLIPVFPLRTFRHKSIFVRSDSGIEHPSQLRGKRVGTPGYSQTSLQWIRGFLQDEYDLTAQDVQWVVSAKDSAAGTTGNPSKNENVFPKGLNVSTGPAGKDESELLLDGDVDALFHAVEPRAFAEGNPAVRRLFKDVRATEQDYFERTGVFPIMHSVAIRNDLVKEHPGLPKAVFNAYSQAKTMAYTAMQKEWFYETMPWYAQELEQTRALMGENFFPYGIEPNRKTLNTLFRYSYEQGLASRKLTIEELFEPSTLDFLEA